MAAYGLRENAVMRFVGNDELDQRDKDEAKKADEKQIRPEVSSLAGHVRNAFTVAVTAKQSVQEEMLRCLRQRNGIYEADVLQGIQAQGGTEIYMMITDIKSRALESFLEDSLIPVGERPFEAKSSPIPEIPPEIAARAWMMLGKELEQQLMAENGGVFDPRMLTPELLQQEGEKLKQDLLKEMKAIADEAAKELSERIDDEFVEGKWYEALSDFIRDVSTYPTAFVVGPTYRKKKVLEWEPIPGTQLSQVKAVEKIVKEYDRFDPFDVYPSPGAKSIQDGELCLRMRYRRSDLVQMKGVPGYDGATIDKVLDMYGSTGFRDYIYTDTEHADLHDRQMETWDPTGWIDGVKFFGSVQGLMLRQWGMDKEQVPDPFMDYNITAIVIGNYVIMARINHHPLGKRNIYSASYKKRNGSIWGQSPPRLMRDIQSLCNAIARAICNNVAIASGPQVWVNAERVPPGTDITSIYPWKIWTFMNPKTGAGGSNDRPMEFFQPNLHSTELMGIYDYFFKQASEVTGIPAYTSENLRGAGKTARGLAMLRNDAARGLRSVVRNIDNGVISPSVEEHWLTIIMEDPEAAKGDVKIVARASDYLIQQEQLEIRRQEMLDRTNNPVDLQILGIDGRAELLRENARALKMDVDKIIPSKEDMIMTMVQAQVDQVIMRLAQALGIPPEQLMAILQGPQPGQQQGPRQIAPESGVEGTPMEATLPQ